MARGLRGRTAVRDAHGKVDERLSHVGHDNPPRFVTLAGFSLLSQALLLHTAIGNVAKRGQFFLKFMRTEEYNNT